MEGSLKVKDIPKVWNEKMQAYFGIVPKTDAEGCLQDIHWSLGSNT
jgi:carboxypeptidase Taq